MSARCYRWGGVLLLLMTVGCDDGATSEVDSGTDGATDADDADLDVIAEPDGSDVLEDPDAMDTTGDGGDPMDVAFDPGNEDVTVEDSSSDEPGDDGPILEGCGDGERDPGELCDDGNRISETCDEIGPRSCLADCSLWTPQCGDGYENIGEQCDDGNDDSMDGCTTSCTENLGDIGAPCLCTGPGCDDLDFSTGMLVGCDALAELSDTSRVPACLRSVFDPTYGFMAFFPGGYCTLTAVSCSGLLCSQIGQVGDVDTFVCPDGYAVVTVDETVFGTRVITRTCHVQCTSEADCRWNEQENEDSPWAGCGHYRCLVGGDGGESICMDERM